MLPIYWRESALEGLATITAFIAARNEPAAVALADQIEICL
ncbi:MULTISPECIES: hypothetical protein [unclassified Thiomonas]